MASLAQLPELVGFFSYSREDDKAFRGSLWALRDAIQRELSALLGRNEKDFRLWQDQDAIAPGDMWESAIASAIEQSVFFIPIITPRGVASKYCKFEFESFLAREATLGRNDLIFPIHYIEVPALLGEAEWRGDPVLAIVAKRQYVDWRDYRRKPVDAPDFGQEIEVFCRKIVKKLREPWLSPEERRQLEVETRRRAEEQERMRLEAEAERQAEEERLRKESEAKKLTEGEAPEREEAVGQASEEKSRREEPRSKLDEQTRGEAEARRQAERDIAQLADVGEPETQEQSSRQRRPSRRDMVLAGMLVAAMAAGAAVWWTVRPKEEVQPQTEVTASVPAAQPKTTATAPAPAAEKEETHAQANMTALTAAQERALKAGDSFKECADCPEMIVAPAGRFLMGSPAGQGDGNEHPQHEVTIAKPVAIAKFALTFDEWDACSAQGGCRRDVSDHGWGRGRRPVVNVSWDDAQTYVKWLSGITGKPYRLLSEAEYEYAARAGTETAYPWGDDLKLNSKAMANCDGCGSEWDNKQTAPVGSFPANVFGLYDMVGNVWAWTEDCWNGSYQNGPADGSPWTMGDCSRRVVRGGFWKSFPVFLRAALRNFEPTAFRNYTLGFRVARTLNP